VTPAIAKYLSHELYTNYREGTTPEKARETCLKFVARSAVLATDGFIVYDIQDEEGRTTLERPFPFRKTLDPAWYAALFPALTGKDCIVYKCAVEENAENFKGWLTNAVEEHNHTAFNLVGAPTSSRDMKGLKLVEACAIAKEEPSVSFGCVCIPERHVKKGNECTNMIAKASWGAEWFITQGIYDADPTIRLLNEYGALCREQNITPKKVILSFAPCGRPKTMTFIRWLGMSVPAATEARIMESATPVAESVAIGCENLINILASTKGCGVPLGINVESLSIYKEEIDAAMTLFQKLQVGQCINVSNTLSFIYCILLPILIL
jgi:hypothetical protein